ncbi:hypothetical protein EMN47_17720 [Prolixibacteraceae bacterium JC049]|nr:hypothetical protein [Prolixibacteraceae bacterium JC049]
MSQTFSLKKGTISFDKDKIIINDNARKQKWIFILTSCFYAMIAILIFLEYYERRDTIKYWVGLSATLINILALASWLLRSVRTELSLIEVKSIKLKKRFGNKLLDIELKNNRFRRVMLDENIKELQEFIEDNF